LVRNLWDEHGRGDPERSHRALYARFLRSLGVAEPLKAVRRFRSTRNYVQRMLALCRGSGLAQVMGALCFGVESCCSRCRTTTHCATDPGQAVCASLEPLAQPQLRAQCCDDDPHRIQPPLLTILPTCEIRCANGVRLPARLVLAGGGGRREAALGGRTGCLRHRRSFRRGDRSAALVRRSVGALRGTGAASRCLQRRGDVRVVPRHPVRRLRAPDRRATDAGSCPASVARLSPVPGRS